MFRYIILLIWGFSFDLLGQSQDINNFNQHNASKVSFTENKGQVSDQYYQPRADVLFYGESHGLSYHLRDDGVSYQLYRVDNWKKEENPKAVGDNNNIPDQTTLYRTDINWVDFNSDFTIEKGIAGSDYTNYYLASCPDGVLWVKSYESIVYKNIYDGIDLKWYSNNGTLEYDFEIAPGADVSQIKWEVEGVDSLFINDEDELVIRTPLGDIKESAPIAFQDDMNAEIKWKLNGNIVGFEIIDYDNSLALTIDPTVRRKWGTYYYRGVAFASSVDDSSYVYITGVTAQKGIATVGSHQTSLLGTSDGFLAKFDSKGNRQWCTYYGGASGEEGNACVADAFYNIYMIGRTYSNSAIATTGSFQSVHGGSADAFLVKFNHQGVRQWGTYFGGTLNDLGYGCAVDDSSYIYMCGHASSGTLSSSGSHQSTLGGWSDAFLVKFDSNGNRQWSTYNGGSGHDHGYKCAVDDSSNVYLSGMTASTSGISTSGSHQTTFGGSNSDAFIAKFNSSGVRQWGTYYGGPDDEYGFSCAIDLQSNIYLTGYTKSTILMATSGSHQSSHGGYVDAFLVKFNSNGTRQWGTYYGGTGSDLGQDCMVDRNSNVYITGRTNSITSISTPLSYQEKYGGTNDDAFLVKFNSNGVRQWGTYYGGISADRSWACSIDDSSNLYIAGETYSDSSIATAGSFKSTFSYYYGEVFLAKLSDCYPVPDFSISNICIMDTSLLIDLSVNVDSVAKYEWDIGNDGSVEDTTFGSISYLFPDTGSYDIKLKVTNSPGCMDSLVKTISIYDNDSVVFSDVEICPGDSTMIFGLYRSLPNIYIDSFISEHGCDSINCQELIMLPVYQDTLSALSICDNDSVTIFGAYQKIQGFYSDSSLSQFGCDSVSVKFLEILPEYDSTLMVVNSCIGDSVLIFGSYRKTSGLFYDSLFTSALCDSVLKQELIIYPTYQDTLLSTEVCMNDSIDIFGEYRYVAGYYQDSNLSFYGCDSVGVKLLEVNPVYLSSKNDTICHNNMYHFLDGDSSRISISDTSILNTNKGCDSIWVTHLFVDSAKCHNDTVVYSHSNNGSAKVENIGLGQNLYCNVTDIMFRLSDATNGAGTNDASGRLFNTGLTEIKYTYKHQDGSPDSCTFNVMVSEKYVGIEEHGTNKVRVFPNPNEGSFTIVFSKNEFLPYQLTILDTKGAIIKHVRDIKTSEKIVRLSGASRGIYYLKLKNEQETIVKRISIH